MSAPFRLTVLGTAALDAAAGTPLPARVRERRQLALLAVLASARGRPVSRDRLALLLAPDLGAARARARLSDTAYVLRRALGAAAVVAHGDALRLDPTTVASDVETFEGALDRGALADAVHAYGGPFLDGFYLADSGEFERWSAGERDRLARRRLRALEQLAAAAERDGALDDGARWLAALAEADPLDAAVAQRAVSALADAGEPREALRVGRLHVGALREELDDEPAPAMRAMLDALQRRLAHASTPAPAAPSSGSRIAVLPLADLSPRTDDAFLADALSHELAFALSRVPGLRVTAPASTALLRASHGDARRSAERLGVDWLLEGSVRRDGDRVRLRLQLVDAADGFTHWSERWDGRVADLLAQQTRVAESVARTTGAVAGDVRPPGHQGVSTAAYLAYLRARSAGAQGWGRGGGSLDALRLLDDALALAPTFAAAWAMRASARLQRLIDNPTAPADALREVVDDAERALALDASCGDAHLALGLVALYVSVDFAAGERHLRRALELDPAGVTARGALGWLLAFLRRPREAIALLEEALRLDPLSSGTRLQLAYGLYWTDQHERARALCADALAGDPGNAFLLQVAGLAASALGDHAAAVASLEQAVAVMPQHPVLLGSLGCALARGGAAGRTREIARTLAAQRAGAPSALVAGTVAFAEALVRVGCGDRTGALDALETAWRTRTFMLSAIDVYEPFDALAGEPRLDAVRRGVGLAPPR